MDASFRISESDAALLRRFGINTEAPLQQEGFDIPSETHVVETFPSEEETILGLQQWYRANDENSEELLNGSKSLHLLEFYVVVSDLYLSKLPPISDLVGRVWKLIPQAVRKVIKAKAQSATAADKASIAATITSFVANALALLGVPPIVIRTILGPVVRRVVDWIVQNVAQLPD